MGVGAAIGGLASVLGVSATAGGFALAALRVGVAVGLSVLTQKKPTKPGVQARTLTSRGTLDARQLVYGEALVAGSLAYRNTHGAHNSELWAVHLLAGHQCEAITDVWLDNRVISESAINSGSAAGGAVTTGTFAPARSGGANTVEIYKHLGTDAQTVDSALDTASSNWTSSHRLRGITYAVTMFKLNDRTASIWEAGDPANVKFLVQGKIVYDPRLDTSAGANPDNASYFAWTDNPALCLADYLRDEKFSPFPGGIDADRIDWDAVEDAADDCDTLVAIPTSSTEKRFTFNGVLYGTASPEENVQAILSSMNGSLIFTGGEYVIRAGVYESPTDTLSEDDIIGPFSMTSALDSDKRVNTIKAVYIDKEKLYEPTETAPISVSSYVTRDGGDELVDSIELPGVDGWYHAQRICLKRLYEADQQLVVVLPCNLKAARLVPGERVSVTISERGWSSKVFKVLDWEFFDRGGDQIGVNVTLREDDSSAYADPVEGDYNTLTAGGTLTIANPEPIPSVDTIPRGIRYGEGAWNVELVNNSNDGTEDSNDGEIYLKSGTFILPDGTTRTITDGYVATPYEGTTNPPDGRFYLIWGATSPDTRFGSSTYGNTAAETAGLFTAIYDRFNGQWYAVDNSNNETSFTPAGTDFVVATGTKTSASGGIDSLTALVTFVENPEATVGATAGTDLYDADGNVISDSVITNFDDATALGFNPAFAEWTGTYPVGWSGYGNGAAEISRETSIKNTGPNALRFAHTGVNAGTLRNADINYAHESVIIGSIDAYVVSVTSGGPPGFLIDMVDGSGNYYRKEVPVDTSIVGEWQRVFFKVSQNDYTSVSGSPSGGMESVRAYFLTYNGTNIELFTGTVIYDNLRFAIISPDVENEAQLWADISGSGLPEDDATVGAEAGVNFVAKYVPGETIIASADSQEDTHSSSFSTVKSFQLQGEGEINLFFQYFAAMTTTGEIRVRQGATDLDLENGGSPISNPYSLVGANSWVDMDAITATLDNADDEVDIAIRRSAGVGVADWSVRSVRVRISAIDGSETTLD